MTGWSTKDLLVPNLGWGDQNDEILRGDDIPACIKRDKNNIAPFMVSNPVHVDPLFEMWAAVKPAVHAVFGHGWTPVHPALVSPHDGLRIHRRKADGDRAVHWCSCGLMSGECKRAGCPNREVSPPASFPWERPPSGSKS